MTVLTAKQIEDALTTMPGWTFQGDKLHREYRFGTFKEAVSFIVRIGFEAERMNHHPEIWNVYGTVKIALATHDAGNELTDKDVALARSIEGVSWV